VLSLVVLRLLDALHLVVDTSMGGVAVLSFRGTMDHTTLFVVLYYSNELGMVSPWWSYSFDRMVFANPTFEQMAWH
jgi:hypothetical protein